MLDIPPVVEKLLIDYWHVYTLTFPKKLMSEDTAELYVDRIKKTHMSNNYVAELLNKIKNLNIVITNEEMIELMPYMFGGENNDA